jgi:uncharacterized protein (DUF58 family)
MAAEAETELRGEGAVAAESLREEYQQRLADHRAQLEEFTQRLGWSFMVHHTDRPPTEPLLTLVMRLAGEMGVTYRTETNAEAAP